MRIIESVRADDDLSSFGKLLRFAALMYEDEDEGEANGPFTPHGIDGDVVFPSDRASADATFDAWVASLKAAEGQFLEEGEEEGFVALLETPKGLMILAGSNLMGYPEPDLDTLLPGARRSIGIPHVTWERILQDVFGERSQ